MPAINGVSSTQGKGILSAQSVAPQPADAVGQAALAALASPASNSDPTSIFRRIFRSTSEMKQEFVKFLTTIFYTLDETKVLAEMDRLLADPNKTDEQVYKELQQNIGSLQKKFPFFYKLFSLFVLKKGMGRQAAELTQGFRKEKFHDYMEIYDRRYMNTIRGATGMPLNGKTIAVCNAPDVGFRERLEAGSLLYPYNTYVPLNDRDCVDPLKTPEKTHKPIAPNEVADNSIDMIACLGGLHHIPADRMSPLVQSMHRTLRPGGLMLMREHDAATEDIKTIAAGVHTFVNVNEEPWEVESKEIRDFRSMAEWTQFMEAHGFTRITPKALILKDDPTANAMTAFVKTPKTIDELKQAMSYRNDCLRPKDGTRATWIEWGNVRFSKQYAEFVQDHHDYAFDYIGHLRQHWKHFYYYVKESLHDKDVKLKDLIFSDNMAMNLFILTIASIQCSISAIVNTPSRLIARWKHGENWRQVANLTDLEKFHAQVELEYSNYIDHTPFYMFDYISKIKEMWNVVLNSKESLGIKAGSVLSAAMSSVTFLFKAAISAPIRAIYTSEANLEPDTIKMVVRDPNNTIDTIIGRWEKEKDSKYNKNQKIEVIYATSDGVKLISVPRYRPFTKICGYIAEDPSLDIVEIGSQKEISVDVLLRGNQAAQKIEGARVVYEMENLQNPLERYVTYQVNVSALKSFQNAVNLYGQNIEYIHE